MPARIKGIFGGLLVAGPGDGLRVVFVDCEGALARQQPLDSAASYPQAAVDPEDGQRKVAPLYGPVDGRTARSEQDSDLVHRE